MFQRLNKHRVTAPQLDAYHHACGIEDSQGQAFPLYLAAVTLPDFIEVARAAVSPDLHAGGLHAGHEIETEKALRPGMSVETEIFQSFHKQSFGELIGVESISRVGGDVVARQRATFFFRDNAETTPATPPKASTPASAQITTRFPEGTAEAYGAASGDTVPIHFDSAAALAAGFDRPIAQGLCTMAFVVADVARAMQAAPSDIRSVGARFSGAVYWDDVLVTETSRADSAAESTFLTTTDDGRPVLNRGFLTVSS